MALSNKDLSDIAKEFATAKDDAVSDKSSAASLQTEIAKKNEQVTRCYILYNNTHVERITPYETEHMWLNGTTYTTITQSQIETFSPTEGRSTYFFPTLWTKSNPKLTDNGNGNPQTTTPNSEYYSINESLENQGLITQIDLLKNGQAGAANESLFAGYTPGAASIQLTAPSGFTIGRVLYITGSGTSALVRITDVVADVVTITEIIPPTSTISAGGTVVENIAGFNNAERNTLTSVSFQRILTELTNRIKTAATNWNTALTNQLTQLNINIDSPSQISAAKAAIPPAQTAYSTWWALSDTGASGKFVDSSLTDLATAYNTRNAGIATRASQITTALGAVTQDTEGIYSGNGLYLQRFKCLSFLINTANGPLYQANGMENAKTNFQDKVASTADKLATYSNLVRYGAGTANPVGHTLKIDNVSQFSISDSIILTANDLAAIQCTITGISGSAVTLSATIPKEYTLATKIGIIKSV